MYDDRWKKDEILAAKIKKFLAVSKITTCFFYILMSVCMLISLSCFQFSIFSASHLSIHLLPGRTLGMWYIVVMGKYISLDIIFHKGRPC